MSDANIVAPLQHRFFCDHMFRRYVGRGTKYDPGDMEPCAQLGSREGNKDLMGLLSLQLLTKIIDIIL